jgi:hypothetical protein
MTPITEQFLRCVIKRNWSPAYDALITVPSVERFYAFAALDPIDRAALRDARLSGPPSLRAVFVGQRINYALAVVTSGEIPSSPPPHLQMGDGDAARLFLGRRYADPEALPLWRDVTGWLPPANPNPRAITDADIELAAQELNVEVAAVRAVAEVESRDQGFENGRPIIRYELHKFRNGEGTFAGTAGIYDRTHRHLSQRKRAAGEQYHNGTQPCEYSLMHAAMMLCDSNGRRRYSDAWKATSWGRFQVMGFNHAAVGWSSIESFVAAMCTSEVAHLRAFVGYINAHNLARHLRNHNWEAFVEVYNGEECDHVGECDRREYHVRIQRAYNRHRQRELQQGRPAGRQPTGIR